MLKKICSKKVYKMAKNEWGTPLLFLILIIISMFLISVFESIGVLQKERNLDMRLNITNFGNVQKIDSKYFSNKLEKINEKKVQDKKDRINQIIIEGMILQKKYEMSHKKDQNFFDV